MKRLVVPVAAAVAALAVASGALSIELGTTVNLPKFFSGSIGQLKTKTSVPILLPGKVTLLDKLKTYPTVEVLGAKSYSLVVGGAANCTADACFLASFGGEKGGTLGRTSNVTLGNGDKAWFHPSTCGGSCAPVTFEFVHAGVLYSFQDSDMLAKTAKATMIALANGAIAAGPR